MRLPRPSSAALVLSLAASLPLATAFDCRLTASGISYDLTALGGLRTAASRTSTPPTDSEARVRLELCGEGVGREDGLADEDQCPSDALACLKLLNIKPSADEGARERVTSVIPIWERNTPSQSVFVTPMGQKGEEGLKLWIEGAEYAGSRQSLNITLRCAPDAREPNPSFLSYTAAHLSLDWATPDACPRDGSDSGGGDGGDADGGGSSSGSSSGWGFWGVIKFFFWLGIIGLILYFAIGIFYNHQQYSARGWDLVPHRDFWREFPALVRDLSGHVFNNVRGSGSRGGYSSLG